MRYLIAIITIFTTFLGSAQDSVIVVAEILDKKYEDPIQNVDVSISMGAKAMIRRTRSRGKIVFRSPKGVGINFQLSHEKYDSEKYYRKIPVKMSQDTVKYVFTMKMEPLKTQELQELVIAAPGVPVKVFGTQRRHVEDFEIQNDGNLLLLTYPKRLKKGSEIQLFDGRTVLNSFHVPGVAEEMVRDYRGNPHVICKEKVFGIYARGKQLGVSTLDKNYFLNYIAPIVDTIHTKMYFSTFSEIYPAFEYKSVDLMDSTYKIITGIKDDLMMELYRSEYKWMDIRTKLWAKNKEYETGVDAEVIVGANYFTQSIYYKELYAPMFQRNDSLFVFDYYKDKLRTYDRYGNAIDSIGLYHHYQPKRTGWKRQLIQDRVTGQIYALFDRAGFSYLGLVDTKTGEITEQVKLEYRYVKKVAIHNNFVYYIYRPFESAQKKYLYKERLPYSFGSAKVPEGDEIVEKETP